MTPHPHLPGHHVPSRKGSIGTVAAEVLRDWARGETYGVVMDVVKEHGGTFGLGVVYASAPAETESQGRTANTRAGKPDPRSGLGNEATTIAPVGGTSSRAVRNSIW